MTCPGCGAPDDQGCRRNCPETATTYPVDAVRCAYQRGRYESAKEAYINGARSALELYGYHASEEQLAELWANSVTCARQARPLHS